jgi:hypothetical protein
MPKELAKKLPEKSRLALESTENLEIAKSSPQRSGRFGEVGKELLVVTDRGDGREEKRGEGVRQATWYFGHTNKAR